MRGIVYALELAVLCVVAAWVLARQWSRLRRGDSDAPAYTNVFVQRFSLVYLGVLAVLWITALPDYFSAVDGVTDNDDPIGSLWYVVACFVVAILSVVATFTVPRARATSETAPPTVRHTTSPQ